VANCAQNRPRQPAGYTLDDIHHSPVLADLIKDKRYTELLAQRKK